MERTGPGPGARAPFRDGPNSASEGPGWLWRRLARCVPYIRRTWALSQILSALGLTSLTTPSTGTCRHSCYRHQAKTQPPWDQARPRALPRPLCARLQPPTYSDSGEQR